MIAAKYLPPSNVTKVAPTAIKNTAKIKNPHICSLYLYRAIEMKMAPPIIELTDTDTSARQENCMIYS